MILIRLWCPIDLILQLVCTPQNFKIKQTVITIICSFILIIPYLLSIITLLLTIFAVS